MREQLTGTGLLVRLGLRRDRFKLPIWTIAVAVFVPYFFTTLRNIAGDDPQAAWEQMSAGQGMLDIFAGPFYAEAITLQAWFLTYTQEFLIAAAIMSILLVVRHTRGEEQSGRAELVRSAIIGRHAPLTAALVIALITNAVLAVLLVIGTLSIGFPAGSAALFGISVAATGLLFAGITAVTVQVAQAGSAAAGLSGVVLVLASLLRGVAATMGNDTIGLWFSPLAWANLTRMLDDERWSPVALTLAATAIMILLGYVLSTRRDVGAGLIAPRRGRMAASRSLAGPFALALRLQRRGLIWWVVAMVVLGLVWGSLVMSVSSLGPDEIGSYFGDDVARGYLSLIGVTQVFIIGVYTLTAMSRAKAEETSGRLENTLGTATGRIRWLASWLTAVALGTTVLTLLAGLAIGAGAASAMNDPVILGTMTGALFARLPELLALAGIAAILYGISPRLQGLAWAMYGYGAVVRFFGSPLGLPEPVQMLSVFQHIPRMPAETAHAAPIVSLTVLAFALTLIALVAFRRRSL